LSEVFFSQAKACGYQTYGFCLRGSRNLWVARKVRRLKVFTLPLLMTLKGYNLRKPCQEVEHAFQNPL
jgi:hypothetical protein